MNNTYLNKRGYIIKKAYLNIKQIDNIKKKLTVKPNIPNDYGQQIQTFKVYLENDSKLYVPKFFGITELGVPDDNRIPEGILNINLKILAIA